MKKLFVATHNKGKQQELCALLQGTGFELVFPTHDDAPDETATTFIENALIKARYGCQKTGLPTLADDAGLVIPALNGAPGIYSARYAGETCDDKANNQKVLAEMKDITDRTAYFCCVVVLLRHEKDPSPLIAEGFWHGEILQQASGAEGFGYDPIFLCPEKNCSAADLDFAVKNELSHRGKALSQLQKLISLNKDTHS